MDFDEVNLKTKVYELENGKRVKGSMVRNIAKQCHIVNTAFCKSIGDTSHKHWLDTSKSLRVSVVLGVLYHLNNPKATASSSHEKWLEHKVKEGWVHGKVKDEKAKTHPCVCPFDDLPYNDQQKDVLFKNTVDSELAYYNKLGMVYV